jgi:hypothetical protein
MMPKNDEAAMNAHQHTYRTPLQRERRIRGWSLQDVVDGLQQLAGKHGYGELGIDTNAVSRHERGVIKRPRAPLPELYSRLYRKPVRLLWPDDDVLAWDGLPDDPDDTEVELPVPWIGRRVGVADVERVRSDSEAFGRMDHRHGGGHVRWMVVEYLRREVAPMLHGTYTDQVGRELLVAAGVLSRRAGMMAYDTGRHAAAQRSLAQALQLARTAGHGALAAHVLTSMSHQAIDLGRDLDALRMLEAARNDAQGAPTLLAKVAVMQARLHARLGERVDCERALSIAAGAFQRADPASDPDWVASADEAYLAGQFGNCYLDLGQPARAERYLQSSLAGYRPDYVRRRAMATALLARAYLDQGELEQACLVGGDAVTLAEALKSRRTLASIADLTARVQPREPAAQAFTEKAAALLRAT